MVYTICILGGVVGRGEYYNPRFAMNVPDPDASMPIFNAAFTCAFNALTGVHNQGRIQDSVLGGAPRREIFDWRGARNFFFWFLPLIVGFAP